MALKLNSNRQQTPAIYQISDFTTFNYLDVDYKIYKAFRITAGFGWVSNGEEFMLNFVNRYAVATVAIKYKVLWLNTEIRGDIPLMTKKQQATMQYTFPVSFALIYRFVPKS